MRILHINLEKNWRGGERQTLFTLLGLQGFGVQVTLAARGGSALAQRAHKAGVPVVNLQGSASLLWYLLRHLDSFDIVHAQTAQGMSILALLRPWLKARVVFTKRTAFDAKGSAKRHRYKWSRADAIVAISRAAAAAPRALGLHTEIIASAVKPMVVDAAHVQQLRTRYRLDGRQVVVAIAALSPEKDPYTLIKAIDLLRASHPEVLCLHCGSGALQPQAQALVQELGLQNNYRLLGFQPQVADFLAVGQVFASSSRFEALGSSVLDACLAGVPVVASATGGHLEILQGSRGRLVPINDAPALAGQIAWVLDNPLAASQMAALASNHVQQVYALDTMVRSYLRLYQRLMPKA